MKSTLLLAAAAAGLANAKPHGHAHVHHKRVPDSVTTVSGPVATALAFVLSDGKPITHDQVCKGIANGDLKWDGPPPQGACAPASSISYQPATPTSSSTPVASSSSSAAAGAFYAKSSSQAAAPSASSSYSGSSSGSGVHLGNVVTFVASLAQDSYPDFPDGVHACSDGPPAEYGPIPVNYLGMEGWTSLQVLTADGGNVAGDTTSCKPGVSCSYSCPPSYQKTQWIPNQPSNGVSIGGILCKSDGMLYKANDNPKLCEKGTGGVSVLNNGGDPFCVCRTEYPSNEAENIPLDVAAGDQQPLTCPDEETYYRHMGAATSAQYYLNNWGVTSNPGCSWNGLGDGKSGNAAPINFGVGSTGGTKWLSIFQNAPTSRAVFIGTVNITGDGISGNCYYQSDADGRDGQYCSDATGCQRISSGGNVGCTVSATGNAQFVVSP